MSNWKKSQIFHAVLG